MGRHVNTEIDTHVRYLIFLKRARHLDISHAAHPLGLNLNVRIFFQEIHAALLCGPRS